MTRILAPYASAPHGKCLVAREPLVFHCNFYNYFLQKTLLLDESLHMEAVITDAACSSAHALLVEAARELDLAPAARITLAQDTFAQLGFGTIDLGAVTESGGLVRLPVSHYGQCLRVASGAEFARPQTYFDAGFAAAAAAMIHDLPAHSFSARIEACQAMGAPEGRIVLAPHSREPLFPSCGQGAHTPDPPPPPWSESNIDEPQILAALATLDFAGNEEGLIPRFGVMLTHHFANFYNRISFEFIRRMEATGLLDPAEELLVEGGLRCGFHTFGGIMTSGEWDAVVRPQCKTREDWVHGMVACVNALGWGLWRVHELTDNRLVMRIYDDYESSGWVGMYGKAARPVSYLAAGGVAGIMNLIHSGDIASKPLLDFDAYVRMFESERRFLPRHVASMAMGHPYTEIVAEL